MNFRNWIPAAMILFAMGAGSARAAKPVIIAPAANAEVRGDGTDGKNVLRWSIPSPPNFLYTIVIVALDPANPGGPALGSPVTIPFGPAEAGVISEGGNVYSRAVDYNAVLGASGSGLFRITLKATDFAFDDTSDPVLFFKGRPIASLTAANGNNPDAVTFSMTADDPDNTPQYLYSLGLRRVSNGALVGPFTLTSASTTLSRADFPGFQENQLVQGEDYDLELTVADTRPVVASNPGLTSTLVTRRFHVNAKPHLTGFSGPATALFNPAPNNNPTNVQYALTATDADHATVNYLIEISPRTDSTFAAGGPFVSAGTGQAQSGTPLNIQVPIPFTSAYWTARATVTDPLGIAAPEVLTQNLTIDDTPVLGPIAARYASDDTVPTSGNRFDFDLLDIAQPLASNSGIVNGGIKFQATGVVDTFFTPLAYVWNFGDGGTSTEAAPTYTYTRAGTYAVSVTATDGFGQFAIANFTIIINDKPRVDITGITPGGVDGLGRLLTDVNSPSGADVDILWTRYNFVRSGAETFNFNTGRTGTTIIDDRRGVANVNTPTPGDLYFQDSGTPVDVPNPGSVASTVNVPNGERLGPITKVVVHGLSLQGIFDDPATDDCEEAPYVAPGTIAIELADATPDGIGATDLAAVADDNGNLALVSPGAYPIELAGFTSNGASTIDQSDVAEADNAASALPIEPGTYAIALTGLGADGFSSADFELAAGADAAASATPTAAGVQAIDLTGATAGGTSPADFADSAGHDDSINAIGISPGLLNAVLTGATADGMSACDALIAAFADLAANAQAISSSTLSISTAGFAGEGLSSIDGLTATASDASAGAPAISAGTHPTDVSGATADGDSLCELIVTAAADLIANAPLIGPGVRSGDTDPAGLEGLTSCDDTTLTYRDVFYRYIPQANGTLALTLDGLTTGVVISVHNAADATTETELACNIALTTTASISGLAVTAGTEYFIRVACRDGAGNFTLTLAGPNVRKDVWYSYTPRANGTLGLDLTGSPDGAVLSLHGAGSPTTALDCASTTNSTQASLSAAVTANTTYLIRVAGAPNDIDESMNLVVTGPGVRRDGFFTYTPRGDGTATISLTGFAGDAILSAHNGATATAGNEVASDGSTTTTRTISFSVTAGTTYLIRVAEDAAGSDQTFSLSLSGPGVRNDVWYSYTPRANGTANLTLAGSDDGSVLSVHTALPGTAANEVDCDETGGSSQAAVSFAGAAGTTYYIRVAGPADASDEDIQLSLDGPGARKDVYYSYTPRADGTLGVTLDGSPASAVVSIHSAAPATIGNTLTSDVSDTSEASVSQAVTAGTTYLIRIAGDIDASDDTFDAIIEGPGVRRDAWLAYTPRASGTATFALAGSLDDAVLSIHDGTPGTPANEAGAAQTSGSTQASVSSLAVTADQTYYIRVAGPMNDSDLTFDLTVSGPGARRDAFYVYTPVADGTTTFTLTGATDDAVLSVLSQFDGTSASEIDSAATSTSQEAEIGLNVTAGTSYYIRIAGPVDDAATALNLAINGVAVRNDVWLTYAPSADGTLSLALAGSSDDTVVTVHSACPGTAANEIAGGITAASVGATVSIPVLAGDTYYIRVAAPFGANSNPTLTLTGPMPVSWLSETTVTLTSPQGTTVTLLSEICPATSTLTGPFDLDDEATLSIQTDCPPVTTFLYRPAEALAAFNSQLATGNWTLTVTDGQGRNRGRLADWSLQIFTEETVPASNGTVNAPLVDDFIQSGSVDHLFAVPGTYQFTLSSPTESFGAETVVGTGDTATVIVAPAPGEINGAKGWAGYR